MRAVNLLPSDLRGAAPAAAPSARPEPPAGIGAYVVLGALAACVAMLAVYVLATNSVKQKQADLAEISTRAQAESANAAKLKPYADYEALANTRVETVKGLAAARFDWQNALSDLSLAMPRDVKLQSLTGDMGLPGAGSTGDPLRGSIQAPAISLGGCARSQASVARMLARLRAVQGVTRVSLSKSERPASDTESACAGTSPPNFSAVIFFEGSDAVAALAPSATDAATAPNVPVPNVVNGGSASSTTGTTPATGTSPASASGTAPATTSSSTPSTTPTTTTTGEAAP